MKKILLFLLATISQYATAQAPEIAWQKNYGGSGDDSAKSIKSTPDGGFLIVGSSSSNDNEIANHFSGTTNADYWVVKTDAVGTVLWQKTYGGTYNDIATTAAVLVDGYVISGYTFSNDGDVIGGSETHVNGYLWTLKIGLTGEILWQNTTIVGEIGCTAEEISVSANGDIYLTGTAYAVFTNYGDSFILKIGAAGNVGWQTVLWGYDIDDLYAVDATLDGGCVVAGASYSTDGVFSGNHSVGVASDAWVAKLDSKGGVEWQYLYGGSKSEDFQSIHQLGDGSYVAAGYSDSNDFEVSGNNSLDGNSDFWLVKLSASGAIQWQKCLGGSGNEIVKSLDIATDGFVLTGQTRYSEDCDVSGNHNVVTNDYWIVKTDFLGNLQWQKTLGGTNFDRSDSVQVLNDGTVIIAGESDSNDGDLLPENVFGNYDYWIVKLNAESLNASNFKSNPLEMFPNPAIGTLNLELTSLRKIDLVIISDVLGKTVMRQFTDTERLNVESLSTGVYLVQVYSGLEKFEAKFVKQ